jgi:hypothetical protein
MHHPTRPDARGTTDGMLIGLVGAGARLHYLPSEGT